MESESNAESPRGRRTALASCILWLMLVYPSGAATNYYVDANNPSARDSNPGTETLPFKTIGKATSKVTAGDTVFIKAGIYREMVFLTHSGAVTTVGDKNGTKTIITPITFAAYPGHEGKAIISAAEPLTMWNRCTGPQDCAGNSNWQHIYWADVSALVQIHPDKEFAVRQVFFNGNDAERQRLVDDVLVDNILFATEAPQYTLHVGMNYDGIRFGQSDRNYLYHPFSNTPIHVSWADASQKTTTMDLSFAGWRARSGYDLQSRDFSYLESRPGMILARPRDSRIVYNPTLEAAIIDLEGKKYSDGDGTPLSGTVLLSPFESKILIALDPNTSVSSSR